ncbi:MAG: transcription termination factor NusA [Alphaproteobacteria bacterium]|nr:transcription termination factor NusA [Alphaproteobacteria bacterium]
MEKNTRRNGNDTQIDMGKALLITVDEVVHEKGIGREDVFTALEDALQKVAKANYGDRFDVRVAIDRKTGAFTVCRFVEVVENEEALEDEFKQITLKAAQKKDPSKKVGDFIMETGLPLRFDRIVFQKVKQALKNKIVEAERTREYNWFKDKVGEIANGTIKHADKRNVYVELFYDEGNRAEAYMSIKDIIPKEQIREGARICAVISKVALEPQKRSAPQIYLSRTAPEFMEQLFVREVPEIYDGNIEICGSARDPGSRAKIAVRSNDPSLDPVGTCVGKNGSRVQNIVDELQKEKIDIIEYSEDVGEFIKAALKPAHCGSIILDEENQHAEVIVSEDQKSLAIGSHGQNVRLASILTGWHIDIMTEAEQVKALEAQSTAFQEALGCDDMIARTLLNEGFTMVEEVAMVDVEELAQIFSEELAQGLHENAQNYVANKEAKLKEIVAKDLTDLIGTNTAILSRLVENDVKTLDDFAGLATDEVPEIIGQDVISEEEIEALIMTARRKLGWIDASDENANG